jgi:hypothetical protein
MDHSGRLLVVAWSLLLVGPPLAQEGPLPEGIKSVRLVETQKVRSTIFEARLVETSEQRHVIFTSLMVDPGRVNFRLALPTKANAASLIRFRHDEDALAAFTGGFLDTYSPATPAGLVQRRNTIQNDLQADPVMTAVVCFSADPIKPVAIMATQEFLPGETKGDCIQTGPFLAKNGQKETDFDALEKSLGSPFARGHFERAILMVNVLSQIVIGVSSPISLFPLRELLLKPAQKGGLGAIVAVGLSGTLTAGLVIEGKDKLITVGAVKTLLPNAVIIRER